MPHVEIAGRKIGDGCPVWIVAEVGINHGGHLPTAMALVDMAKSAGCDAVKFQKMNPYTALTGAQQRQPKASPWGVLPYADYRNRLEFSEDDFARLVDYCNNRDMPWFASCCDLESFEFVRQFNPPCWKVPSAFANREELTAVADKPMILSTGMSTLDETATAIAGRNVLLMHCTSAYPCQASDVNLRAIQTLRNRFGLPVGYSGHERGYSPTLASVAFGACAIERHITLSRSGWGSDQACSLEPAELAAMVSGVREIEAALGDGEKRLRECEEPTATKFRRSA